MRKSLYITISIFLVLCLENCCLSTVERFKKDYGILGTAVTYVSDKVIGEYDDSLPDDFGLTRFLDIAKKELSISQYNILLRYRLEIIPKKTYYLLKVFEGTQLIMFDYSCTSEVDGPILYSDQKFDLDHLEKYDKCKKLVSIEENKLLFLKNIKKD